MTIKTDKPVKLPRTFTKSTWRFLKQAILFNATKRNHQFRIGTPEEAYKLGLGK